MDTVKKFGKSILKQNNQKYLPMLISIVLSLYAGLAAPGLPNSVVKFFDTLLGKLLFLFLIGFTASRNVQVALTIAILFSILLHKNGILKAEEFKNSIQLKENQLKRETFERLNIENYRNYELK